MKRFIQIFISVVFLGLIAFPSLQRSFKIIPQHALFNTTLGVKPVKVNFKNWKNGRLAVWIEQILVRRSGLYGLFIKINNSINYRLRVAAPAYRSDVLIGLHGGLLHSLSIEGINGAPHVTEAALDQTASDLERLEARLRMDGVTMLSVFSPNKAILRPELMPAALYSKRPAPQVISRLLPKLQHLSTPYIDLGAKFSEVKENLYAKSGAHLNHLGACLAASAISQKLNPGGPLGCRVEPGVSEPSSEDLDLARLLNVFSYRRSVELQPVVSITPCTGRPPQNVLFIGTSNLFGIIDALRSGNCLADRDYYFYTKSLYSCRINQQTRKEECTKRTLKKKGEFSSKILSDRKFVVLEAPAARAHQIGFGKIPALLGEKSK
jgi:hypothetical protein